MRSEWITILEAVVRAADGRVISGDMFLTRVRWSRERVRNTLARP
jgi:hypothetical protein